jgi:D-alanine-D-alanine ligase
LGQSGGGEGGSASEAIVNVGIAYDLQSDHTLSPEDPDDLLDEYDSPETIEAIEGALRSNGLTPHRLGGGERLVRALLEERPDLVFNFSEGWGTRSREAHAPALCELLGIPCTHSDPLTMAVTLDKAIAKSLVSASGVPTPAYQVVEEPGFELQLALPIVAKPLREGSSVGISASSILRDVASAGEQVLTLLRRYRQPVLLEEFCPGPELTVGIVGSGVGAEPIGVMEILPRTRPLEEFLYSIEVKRKWDDLDFDVPPRRPASLVARTRELGLTAYRALGCRDVARVDFRVGADGEPKFLDANPMPGLDPVKSDLVILARGVGIGYEELLGRIVASARARHGL